MYRSALVLEYYNSNVYEPASCMLFYEGDVIWSPVRNIEVVESFCNESV